MNLTYDLDKYPASWDFLQWLINARLLANKQGVPKFTVCFVAGSDNGFRRDSVDRPLEARRAILRNVMKPALRLVDAEEAEVGDDIPVSYNTRYAAALAKGGVKIPYFEIPQEYLDEVAADYAGRKPLVLTLREASYFPQRNSNLPAWRDFARRSKQDCVFVRDTAKADEPIKGFETCPRAAKDVLYRAALMRHARCNLAVACGPCMLMMYSPNPWLLFGALRPEIPNYSPGRPEWWDQAMGVPAGGQFPWATSQQRMFWGHDTLPNIEQAWDMLDRLRPPQRRKLDKAWKQHFESFRQRGDRYLDEMQRIDTIEMYERIDDKPADMIVACNILESVPDVDKALIEINNLARKQVLITIRPDAVRTEATWRKLIERRMTIGDFLKQDDGRLLVFYCMPGMKVEGLRMGGALDDEERWSHIESSLARISKRIQPAPAHERRAIIACYGPSLKDTWPHLKQERERENAVLVSVSGAHDFLIEHGLVPDYHVECDPRPHKTQNISLPHSQVKYLLASCCHPSLFDKLEQCDISLWHIAAGSSQMRLIDERHEPVDITVSGGASVGLRSIPLMYRLGYRKISIYGMDCSFAKVGEDAEGKPIVEQWAGKHAGKRQEVVAAECRGQVFLTSRVLLAYMGHFFDVARRLPDIELWVAGNGLLQATAQNIWNPANEQTESAA